jgi:hypothetical protein
MIEAPERPAAPPEKEVRPPEPRVIAASDDPREAWPTVLMTGISVFLSVAAAAWMSAGVFRGLFPRFVAIVAALLGVGLITFSFRTRRPSFVQYLVLPAALVLGAVLAAAGSRGGNVPALVIEAIRTGGIAQPPIPFDPGWRLIIVVLAAALGAASAATAASLNRPKLGVFMPLPLLFASALVQPKETALTSSVVALFLLVGSLAVAYGAELRQEGASSGRFEARRYARGGIAALVLLALLVAISRAGFLFPDKERTQVIPPKKPEAQPLQSDRLLFLVASDSPGPWRLGVLDIYEENAWLLPPFDLERFLPLPRSGEVPEHPAAPAASEDTVEATFTISNVEGHQIPSLAGATTLDRERFEVEFDPRTQTFRLPEGRATSGMTYTVESVAPPSGADLAGAPAPPAEMSEFLEVPIAPNEVVTLLAEAPGDNSWDRLQFVRNAFYEKVIAAGAGAPKDVPPSRVVEMLEGQEATPYEITAVEVLLARWAGVPARIGYGFYQGGKREEGSTTVWEVHPQHGATWLEAYFEGYGWVPVVGIPPRARASLSEAERRTDPSVRPSEELALVVFVPVKLRTIQLLYVVVRYWLLLALPFVAAFALLAVFLPWPVKAGRRFRRRRWAGDSPRERVVVAYANFRDAAVDLNVGDPTATPLKFLDSVEDDPEHAELAWLVTRALWGDLRRDLRVEDVESAEDMAASVTRRLRRAQPTMARIFAMASRASLREPFSREVPNLWPQWAKKGLVRRFIRQGVRRILSPLRMVRRLLPIGTSMILIATILVACTRQQEPAGAAARSFPETLAPADFLGFTFKREKSAEAAFGKVDPQESLVTGGRVFTIRKAGEVLASLQAAEFKPGLGATRREVREGVLESIGTGRFELTRVGGERMFVKRLPEQSYFLWFSPDGRYYQLMVARRGFEEAARVFSSLINFQQGEEAVDTTGVPVEVPDLRRGEDG